MGMKNSDVTQSAANRSDLPHHRFDIVAKDAIYTFPEDVLQFLMQGSDVEFLEHLESELTTVETRQMDSLVIDPALKGEASAKLCESICGIQKRTGRFNGTAYYLAKQDDRSYNS